MKRILATALLGLLITGTAEAQQNQTRQRRRSSGMQNTDSTRMHSEHPGMTPNRRNGVRGMDSTGRPMPQTDTMRMRGNGVR